MQNTNDKAVLLISGSSRADAANIKLLRYVQSSFAEHQMVYYGGIHRLPLFSVTKDQSPRPEAVIEWRSKVQLCKAMIITTPEYLHNMPGSLKNAMEWLTTSGELAQKKVLPITFTPHPPRGEKAMQSLLWTLQALDAQVIGQLALYQQDFDFNSLASLSETEAGEMLKIGIDLLLGQ